MITKYLIVFLISMVPLIELRGAIPYAVAFHIPTLPAYLIAVIGNMLPVPVIFLFARKVLVWGCDKKAGKNWKQKPAADFRSPCCSSSASRSREPAHGPAHWPQVSSIWTLRPAFSPSWAVFSLQASSCCLQVPAYSGQLGRFWRKRLCFRFNSIKFGLQPHRFVFPICAAVFV